MDMVPDRTQLQNMAKKDNETFKRYAQHWREIATQVQTLVSKKELVTTERAKMEVTSGRIAQGAAATTNTNTPPP
ncbi:hypothetical protein CR513_10888, partial [Mucuna pruriens]